MGSHKEKIALGAAIAAGIAGYIFTQTGSDGEDATDDQAKMTEEESYPASKLKTNNDQMDNGEDSSKDDEKDTIETNKKEHDVKPASNDSEKNEEKTDGEKKEEDTKKDENHNDDVTPKSNTGDVYASPVTEAEISKKNPKDDAQDALEGKGKDTDAV